MFRKINQYQNLDSGEHVEYVNRRLEYFHHYWKFQFQKSSGFLFLTEEKWESHNSLIDKVEQQLTHNSKRYTDQLLKLLIDHKYFQNDNIIIKKSKPLRLKVEVLQRYFTKNFKKQNGNIIKKERNCLQHQINISIYLKDISESLNKTNYTRKILKHLIQILHKNQKLDSKVKCDIKFLVNATIIELYRAGYNLQFIRQIPDIILFPRDKSVNFPFSKSRSEFDSEDEYSEFKKSELANINLQKQLASLLNLVKNKRQKGYYIFQINDFDFKHDHPLKIWNTIFYNPQNSSWLNNSNVNANWKDYITNSELYFDEFPKKEILETGKSTCNAIVKTNFRSLYFNYPDITVKEAFNNVEKSLVVLKSIKQSFIQGQSGKTIKGSISKENYILADINFNLYGLLPYFQSIPQPFKIDDKQINILNDSLRSLNKLNGNQSFQKKLIEIYSLLSKVKVEPESFNFKDFWTVISETLFPNNRIDFIEYCQRCMRYKLLKDFYIDIRIFLNWALRAYIPFDGLEEYCLDKRILIKLGIYIPRYNKIKATPFSSKYKEISKYVRFDFLDDILSEIELFENHQEIYLQRVDEWVESILNEVYSERNLGTHNNIENDLSLLKLKDSFLFIANQMLRTSIYLTNKNTSSPEKLMLILETKIRTLINP